jgi:hypothetical protein
MSLPTILRAILMPATLLVVFGGASEQFAPAGNVAVNIPAHHIIGDYVEARTASVFAGGCHYNGELVTTGHDAIFAMRIQSGAWHGVDLSGVTAMGAISCEDNLKNAAASRQSEIVTDSAATPAQVSALINLLQSRSPGTLGKLVSIRGGRVDFDHTGSTYHAQVDGFAELTSQAMPNDECCKQPSLVWYSPLVPLVHRKVGYTLDSAYLAGTVGDPWSRSEENTAFYGAFEF